MPRLNVGACSKTRRQSRRGRSPADGRFWPAHDAKATLVVHTLRCSRGFLSFAPSLAAVIVSAISQSLRPLWRSTASGDK